jgi:hypothetical protein
MLNRVLAVSLLVLVLAPAWAAAEDDAAAGIASGALAPLAVTPPAAPILAGAESATEGATHILTSALYGALAGAIIGTGVALIENGNWGRDIAVGAGVGILIGAAIGASNAMGDARPLPAHDGLGTIDRDPAIQGVHLSLVGGRF